MKKILKNLKRKITVLAVAMIAIQPVLVGGMLMPAKTFADAEPTTTKLVEWNFPNDSDNATADGGITTNLTKTISTVSGYTATFNTDGATTKSAQVKGWDDGSGTKYWQVEFSTEGCNSISFSSKQRSTSTGPKDFKAQYRVGAGEWTDVADAAVTTANDYTTGVLSDKALPSETQNEASVYLRWIMTSNTSVGGGTVGSAGASNIDDIIVTGVDTEIPEITGTPANVIEPATSASGAVVDYTPPIATDNVDGSVAVDCDPSSGTMFPITVTTVTCSASDTSGNVAKSTFTVTVNDKTAPGEVTGLTAAPGNNKVTLDWTKPVDADFAGVNIYRDNAPSVALNSTLVTAETFEDITAINGTTYTYTVKTVDTLGNESLVGKGVTATPKAIVLSPVVTTVVPAVAEVPVNETFGGSSEQGEVKADTTISQDSGNQEENKEEQKEDTKGKKNIPLWGIIFLLVLAGIGGYLFYSQSPVQDTKVSKGKKK